ncbi:hypothetical protein YC2023_099838 [Brassica napus]
MEKLAKETGLYVWGMSYVVFTSFGNIDVGMYVLLVRFMAEFYSHSLDASPTFSELPLESAKLNFSKKRKQRKLEQNASAFCERRNYKQSLAPELEM